MLEFVGVLIKNWRYVLVTVVILAALVYTQVLQHKVNEYSSLNSTLTKQVTELQTTNTDMKAAYDQRVSSLNNAISAQNTQIDKYKDLVVALTKNVSIKTKQASDVRASYDAAAQAILTDSKLGSGSTCDDSIGFLVDGVADLKWEIK